MQLLRRDGEIVIMTSLLKVKKSGKVISELTLDPERTYIAGRKEGADIYIEAVKAVSREHFALKYVDEKWTLEVLSKFGDVIYLSDKVRNLVLEDDLVFFLPPYEFEFHKEAKASSVSSDPSDKENEVDEFEKTMVGQIEFVPQIQFLNEDSLTVKTVTLTFQDVWTAGRDQSCEIVIDDQRVSRRQFQIFKSKSEYYLLDIGSVNGTMLNNKNLVPNEKIKIRSGDKIQVLDNVMLFELKNPNFDQGLMALKDIPTTSTGALVPMGTQAPTILSEAHQQTQNSLIQYSSEQAPLPMMYQQQGSELAPYAPQQHYQQPPNEMVYDDEYEQVDAEEEKKKKIRMVLVAAVVLVFLGYVYNEFVAVPEKKSALKSNDPFAKVNPNELSLLKQSKEIANDYYYKKSYRLTLDETQKILKRLEELGVDYKKTKFGQEVDDLDKKASLAIEAEKEVELYEHKQEEQRKNEEKLNAVVDDCDKKLAKKPNMTLNEYNDCIISVIHLNPSHHKIQASKLKIQQKAEELARQEIERNLYREKVAKLKALYLRAVKTEKEGSFIQAIENYSVVTKQSYPDPENLKLISRQKIAAIEKMISSKSVTFVQEAEKFASEKKYKEAIFRLRAAKKVNPIDSTLDTKIELYKRDLAKEIKPIWEEANIEETYSQVECTENKSCALEKWKKILQMDVTDGEYYNKAFTKLKKYGAH